MLQAIAQNKATLLIKLALRLLKPIQGLRFIVTYDHEKVGISHAIVESKDRHKRLIVTFYDKDQIKRIKNAQESVLRTACHVAQARCYC